MFNVDDKKGAFFLFPLFIATKGKSKMRRLLVLIFLILGVCLNINSSAFGQIALDKNRERLDITPGGITQGSIMVRNFTNKNISVRGYVEDFVFIAPFNGRKKFKPAAPNPYSCAQWITVSPQEFDLPGLGTQKVTYTIKAPADAKGGYYGVIFFENFKKEAVAGMGVVVRNGCSLLLETKGSIKELQIKNISSENAVITGDFLNSGNLALVAKPDFHVMDKKGLVLDRGDVMKEFCLPPQEKIPLKVKIADKIPPGDYTLVLNFALEKGVLIKEVDFSKDSTGNIKILQVKD